MTCMPTTRINNNYDDILQHLDSGPIIGVGTSFSWMTNMQCSGKCCQGRENSYSKINVASFHPLVGGGGGGGAIL